MYYKITYLLIATDPPRASIVKACIVYSSSSTIITLISEPGKASIELEVIYNIIFILLKHNLIHPPALALFQK
jgi:hypothetical protein